MMGGNQLNGTPAPAMTDVDPQPGKKVTLADIAQHASVSAATVSLVLRNKPGVGAATRQRVLDSAQALGYIHTPSNQSMARRSLKTLGLLVKSRASDTPTTNPFYAPVLSGIEAVCRTYQIALIHADVPVDVANRPQATPQLLLDDSVDGLLVLGISVDTNTGALLRQRNLPVVLVDSYAPGAAFDTVVTDNESGAFTITRHLIERGHRHIAILGSRPDAYPSVLERRAGYLRAMQHAGLEPRFADCYLYPDFAEQAVRTLIADHPDTTAIFACNDDLAIEAISTLQQLGKHVPENVSVVGFDNIDQAQRASPPLTTMRIDMAAMGRLAAQLLMNRADAPESGRVRAVLCPDLIERHSTRWL